MSKVSVLARLEKACAAHGQERILVHSAMVNRKRKTVGRIRETSELTCFLIEDCEFPAHGILASTYRFASLTALKMAGADPLEGRERGTIVLTSSDVAQHVQVGAGCPWLAEGRSQRHSPARRAT